MTNETIVLFGCGDVAPVHDTLEPYTTFARPVLATGDIRFAQCERLYSDKGTRASHGSTSTQNKPHMISIFGDCGFNVVSLASNHVLDWGHKGLLETLQTLGMAGVSHAGAGRDQALQDILRRGRNGERGARGDHGGRRRAVLARAAERHRRPG